MAVNYPYCFFVYKNIYIERYSQGRVRTSACCINDPGELTHRIDFEGDKLLASQRKEMQEKHRPKGCAACWHKEDAGTFSYREIVNRDLESFKGDPYKTELLGIDYNVSPICNARCIMCSSLFSSSWAAEDKKFGVPIDPMREYGRVRHNHMHDDLDLRNLNRIYFNGGEPLLTDEPMQMLQRIQQQQGSLRGLRVSMNTNGSIYPDESMLDMLQQCASVLINFSIDACGDAFEYIRNPLSWSTVENVVHRLIALNMPRMDFTIAATVGVHNFLELPMLHSWVDHLNDLQPRKPIELVLQPTNGNLGLHNTSDAFKTKVRSFLGRSDTDQRVLSFLDTPRDFWATGHGSWQPLLAELDRRRGLDWRLALPLLAEFSKDLEN